MIEVQRRVVIARPVDEVLEFVMDVERYQQIDTKIKPVEQVTRTPTRTDFRFHPKLGGIRVPGPTTGSSMHLTPGARIDVRLSHNPLRRLSDFHASFEVEAVDGGTEVLRTLVFTFRPPLNWIVEPILRRRLPAEVDDELQRAKRYLETLPPPATDPVAAPSSSKQGVSAGPVAPVRGRSYGDGNSAPPQSTTKIRRSSFRDR